MTRFFVLAGFVLMSLLGFAQGSETFTNVAAVSNAYAASGTWTGDNGLTWTATDYRTDQVITTGQSATIRNGLVSCSGIPNGITSLTFSHKYAFSGSGGVLEVRINGNLIGSVSPTSTLQTASFTNLNINGAFSLEIKQTVSGQRITIDDIAWTAFAVACNTPTAQPTGLTFSNITNTAISGSFTAASPAADEYLVVRTTTATLSTTPVDATAYNEGDVLGNGIVIARGAATSFTATSLTPSTAYYFHVYAANNNNCSGGPKYYTSTPLKNNTSTLATPACVAPTTNPGALTLTPASTSITGSFAAATGADGYLVVRSTSATLGATPVNGTTYTAGNTFGSGIIIKFGSGTGFAATSLNASTTYYFYVFAVSNFTCAGGPLYNTTARTGNAATTANSTGVPTGYYNAAAGLTCASLKTALKNIITASHNPQSYDGLWSQYQNTDIKARPTGSGNVIWDIYSTRADGTAPYYYVPGSDQCGSYSGEGSCYNREHSFPKSWFNDEMPAYSDYNHIFPTDGYVNGKRSNYKYGEVATATWTSQIGAKLGSSSIAGIGGPVFEPIDEYKGDVARAYLYMVTRYQDKIITWDGYSTEGAETFVANTFPSVEINYLKLMLKWHHQDPVSAKEIARNNGTYSFQGNRNPYIDDPNYADLVWNAACPGLSALPVEVVYFGGKLLGDKVTLNWEVANETNVSVYVVERSFNGTEFATTGTVTAANKTRYTFDDNISLNRGRRIYYRLKKVDKDGTFSYSETFSIHVPMNIKFTVYPNPAKDYVVVQLNNVAQNNAVLQLTDLTGRVVLKQKAANSTYTQVPVATLPNGTYFLILYNGAEQYMQKVVISK